MLAISGYLSYAPENRDFVLEGLRAIATRSREDPGCVEYWWAEDVEVENRFRFFECWETDADFDAHSEAPYEKAFMADYVSRIAGAEAIVYEVSSRGPAVG